MRRVALVSAIYGDYDHPKPLPAHLGYVPHKAYMFTDNPELRAPGWDVRCEPMITHKEPRSMLSAKFWKLSPGIEAVHMMPESIFIWADASLTLNPGFIDDCVRALGDDDISFMRHPSRDCIYDEADFSKTLPRYADNVTQIGEQIGRYLHDADPHPKHWGLFATGTFACRQNDATRELLWNWTQEIFDGGSYHGSYQDQISLPVVVRKMGERLKWNTNIPWWTWWSFSDHNR